jgi:hypothetical protein
MKTKAKIFAAYCLWFGFVLWLSLWFTALAGWLEWKLLPVKTPAQVEFFIMLILYSGFVGLFAWLPIRWMKKRHWEIAQTGRSITFVILLLGCATLSAIAWDNFVAEKFYNCTDSVPFDFLHPGDWVHGNYIFVPQINPTDPMDKPDSIKEGWSVPKLWILWWPFIFASVAISAALAFLIFYRSKKISS